MITPDTLHDRRLLVSSSLLLNNVEDSVKNRPKRAKFDHSDMNFMMMQSNPYFYNTWVPS